MYRAVIAGLILSIAAPLGASVWAADTPKTYDDPARTDADFAFQGEYSGLCQIGDSQRKLGVQVIALGDGMFRAVFCLGGLPGEQWDGQNKFQIEGQRQGDALVFTQEKGKAHLAGGNLTIQNLHQFTSGKLERVERKSPTLGKKAPQGAVVLFDGSTPEQFQRGQVTEDRLLMPGVSSKQHFGDHSLHLEFRTPYMPTARGQKRGNSGCYLQGRFEVQILDSFGLEGKNNECGGLYEIRDPSVNMCYPPLCWQTYDIDFTAARYDENGQKYRNARISVRHNGVVVHEDVELPRTTRAAPVKEGPDPGTVYLQDHGDPVRFRNVWVVEKAP